MGDTELTIRARVVVLSRRGCRRPPAPVLLHELTVTYCAVPDDFFSLINIAVRQSDPSNSGVGLSWMLVISYHVEIV
jgi:hypothetical protein